MSLRDAYDEVAEILGNDIEPFAVTAVVEDLRLRWRPRTTRVILLAESHVWTTEQELKCTVELPDGVSTPYARFVYCLGYGESAIVDGDVAHNRGTPQYWTLFHDAVHGPGVERKIVGRARSPATKLELLEEMKKRGIWLVDASIVALYGGPTIGTRRYREVLV